MRFFWIWLLIIVLQINAYAQNARISIQMKNASIENVMKELEKQTGYRFFYDADAVKLNDLVDVFWSLKTVREALNELFGKRGIAYRLIDRHIVLYIVETVAQTVQTPQSSVLRQNTINEFGKDSLNTQNTRISAITEPLLHIKSLPAFPVKADVLKVLHLKPEVQLDNEVQLDDESSNGLYVRGGRPDQNIILLDGLPVYNALQLFGYFSIFKADSMKSPEILNPHCRLILPPKKIFSSKISMFRG